MKQVKLLLLSSTRFPYFTFPLGHADMQSLHTHSTLGRSSKRLPIHSVMKRITTAERAPATCGEESVKRETIHLYQRKKVKEQLHKINDVVSQNARVHD